MAVVHEGLRGCYRELEECQRAREWMGAHGRQMGDCTSQTDVFCFASATPEGLVRLECSADLPRCRANHDFVVAHKGAGEAKTDCTEEH